MSRSRGLTFCGLFSQAFDKHIQRLASDRVNMHNKVREVKRSFIRALFGYVLRREMAGKIPSS